MRELKLTHSTDSLKRMSTNRLYQLLDSAIDWYHLYRSHGPRCRAIKALKLTDSIHVILNRRTMPRIY